MRAASATTCRGDKPPPIRHDQGDFKFVAARFSSSIRRLSHPLPVSPPGTGAFLLERWGDAAGGAARFGKRSN